MSFFLALSFLLLGENVKEVVENERSEFIVNKSTQTLSKSSALTFMQERLVITYFYKGFSPSFNKGGLVRIKKMIKYKK